MGTLRLPGHLARQRLFRRALAMCLVAITTLALIPPGHEPLPVSDKVNHIAAFLVLAWLADHAYPEYSGGAGLWVALLGYGLLLEGLQGNPALPGGVPRRSAGRRRGPGRLSGPDPGPLGRPWHSAPASPASGV